MVLGGVAGICSSEFSEKSMGLDARGRLFSGLGGLLTLGGDSGIAGTLEGVVGKGGASGSSSATRSLSSAANYQTITIRSMYNDYKIKKVTNLQANLS